jgi:Protein of unknown function (DUF2971)
MPLTEEEKKRYVTFVQEQLKALGALEVRQEDSVWHYTTGDALLSIVQSNTLYATQVSCLNDSMETRYATNLFREALLEIKTTNSHSQEEASYLERVITATSEESAAAAHLSSWWFVTCFSEEKDDLSQWRAYGGSNAGEGYALAFNAGQLFSPSHAVARVNYDSALHKELATKIAKATLQFISEGREKRRNEAAETQEAWVSEFLNDWIIRIGVFGPVVKDPSFRAENEYRIVHQLRTNDFPKLQFKQKKTLMSRHLPLVFQSLPIVEVMLGPAHSHREISRVSINTCLQQHGYNGVPVSFSAIPFRS